MNSSFVRYAVIAFGLLAGWYVSSLGDKPVDLMIWFCYATLLVAVSGALSSWLLGEIDAFDPLGLLAAFSVHFFGLSPIYQYASGSYPYLPWDSVTDAWVPYWFLVNCIIVSLLFFFLGESRLKISNPSNCNFNFLSWNSFPEVLVDIAKVVRLFSIFILILALLLKIFVLAKFGGIGGMMAAYQDRIDLGGTQYNPLAGIGPLVFISDAAPVVAAIVVVLTNAFINPRPSYFWGGWMLLLGIPVSFFYVGLIGSRSNTVYTVFILLCYSSMFWRPIRAAKLVFGGLLMAAFMNGYLAYKFGGVEAVFNESARRAAFSVKQLDNPLEFLFVRDFGRMDVQVIAMREMFDEEYPPAWGRSYVGGIFSIVPSAVFPGRPENFTLEKTEIVFPGMTLDGDKATTLVFGGAGEAWVNWKWFAPLVVVPYYFTVVFCVRRFRVGRGGAWDSFACPIYSLMPIALLVYDSNSLLYFFAQFAICPILISFMVRKVFLTVVNRRGDIYEKK